MPIESKKKLLKEIKNRCIKKSKEYKSRYKKLKRTSDRIDLLVSFLNSANIACLISGLTYPPVLFASIACSSLSLIISRVQQSYNFKHRYTTHNNTVNQYNDIAREITNTLYRNHLTNEQLEDFIEYINSKLSIVEDVQIL
jgi:hypothetical protein